MNDDNLIIGLEISDDAAVYRVSDDKVAILTVDFFTPVVDDPYTYGAVAAANALSDIYAMGGEVTIALNICGFPKDLDPEIISEIMRGGAEKVKEAGGILAGGHTVDDAEPKYGLSVMGLAHPDAIMTKSGARNGDILLITKPLGTGIITTAGKNQKAEQSHIDGAVESMAKLNRDAARILVSHGIRCCTDITGFALPGHLSEVVEKSGVGAYISYMALPFLEGAHLYAEQNLFPGGTFKNREAYQNHYTFDETITEQQRLLMFTPETSGGLLAAVPQKVYNAVLDEFYAKGVFFQVIGEITEEEGIRVLR